MSRKSYNRKAKRFWTPVRIGLIGLAMILVAVIYNLLYRNNTGALNQPASAPSKPAASATQATATSGAPGSPASPIMAPAKVLETNFPTIDGKQRRLGDYAGKILVVDIWATWCGPCRVEIPHLVELANEFQGRGVEVIGMTTEDPVKDAEKVRDFAREFKINYPIGFANGEFALYLTQGRDVIPQTYVIGRKGQLHKHFIGFNAQTSPPQLRAAVEEAVAAK